MKKALIPLILLLLVGLAGCGKSAQEKVADEQLKTQNEVVAGFQKAAEDAKSNSSSQQPK